MKHLYINKDTGEVHESKEGMLKQWREEYDGDDPTNCMHWTEQYEMYGQLKTQF